MLIIPQIKNDALLSFCLSLSLLPSILLSFLPNSVQKSWGKPSGAVILTLVMMTTQRCHRIRYKKGLSKQANILGIMGVGIFTGEKREQKGKKESSNKPCSVGLEGVVLV